MLQNNKSKFLLIFNVVFLLVNIVLAIFCWVSRQKEELLLILPTKYNFLTTETFFLNENYKFVKQALEKNVSIYKEKKQMIIISFGNNEYQFKFNKSKLRTIDFQSNNGLERIMPRE